MATLWHSPHLIQSLLAFVKLVSNELELRGGMLSRNDLHLLCQKYEQGHKRVAFSRTLPRTTKIAGVAVASGCCCI